MNEKNLLKNITSIKQTCKSSPSQWVVKLKDGRMMDIRYRWGVLSMRISESSTNDIFDVVVSGKQIFKKQIGDSLDGYMKTKDMLSYLKEALEKGHS